MRKTTAAARIDQQFDRLDHRLENLQTIFKLMELLLTRQEVDLKEIKETIMTRELGQRILDQLQIILENIKKSNAAPAFTSIS